MWGHVNKHSQWITWSVSSALPPPPPHQTPMWMDETEAVSQYLNEDHSCRKDKRDLFGITATKTTQNSRQTFSTEDPCYITSVFFPKTLLFKRICCYKESQHR